MSATWLSSTAAATRAGGQEGWIDFIPNCFSEIPSHIERGQIPADVVFSMASPMDAHGYFSLSLGADYTMAAIAKARAVVLEVNPNVPFACGNCHVHVSQVAALVESSEPVLEVGLPKIGPVQVAIGKYVADMIDDGSTLQIGYGGIPDAVVDATHAQARPRDPHRDDRRRHPDAGGVRRRHEPAQELPAGKDGGHLRSRLQQALPLHGSQPGLEIHPVDFTNDPSLAGLNDNLVAINATLQIDLLGQCGSESLGHLPYSGTGGQSDFVRAANRSRGGKAFIVLPSTAKDDTISRIVPALAPGTHVSTSKNDVNYVVTEYGVAQLRGKSAKQRANELIGIAHPTFRAELTEQAGRMKSL